MKLTGGEGIVTRSNSLLIKNLEGSVHLDHDPRGSVDTLLMAYNWTASQFSK